MIGIEIVRQVRTLWASGTCSQRQIARRVGVSRGTVHAIINGRHIDREAKRKEEPPMFSGPYVRCRGCGGMVQMPCLLCRVRALPCRAGWQRRRRRACQSRLLPSANIDRCAAAAPHDEPA